MGTVTNIGGTTHLDIPSDKVLEGALDAKLESTIVLGYLPDGQMYVATSQADGGAVLWLLEQAKLAILGQGPQ